MTKITLPCHWDYSVIEQLFHRDVNKQIKEVYGALSHGGPVGHGRSEKSVVNISKTEALSYRKKLYNLGIDFVYLLNAPFRLEKNNKTLLDDYLEWIISQCQPGALTISSFELMKYIRAIYPKVDIHISTIASVKNGTDLKRFIDIRPSRVVPHHDSGKNWKNLEEIVRVGQKHNIEVEILSTESCIYQCPTREGHYRYLASKSQDKPFHLVCNSKKLIRPREFLLAGGIIRPEDLGFYENLGVSYFKISGRSKPANWLPDVVEAYLKRSYHGNLIRLLGIDPQLKAEDWIFLDNKSLDGFIENFPQTDDISKKNSYCEKWIIKLYQKGAFKLTDKSEYHIEDGSLKLAKPGFIAQKIIDKELCNVSR